MISASHRIAFILTLAVGLIFWLSLRSSPVLSEIAWFPDWLTLWADRNGNLRTALPFFILSFYIGLESCISFSLSRSLPALMWLLGFYGLFALLLLVEFAQLTMPNRYFSWSDI
ncbi:MAG: hypothetical protein ACPGSB_07535, partial [Opitutales bacterium]